MSQHLTGEKSTLVQVMAWCRQATSHYLSQCWPMLVVTGWGISGEIALRWMSLDLTRDDKSTLVQVMAWCRQATSHYLSQCWPRSVLPYVVTRLQWVEYNRLAIQHSPTKHNTACNTKIKPASSRLNKNFKQPMWPWLWPENSAQHFIGWICAKYEANPSNRNGAKEHTWQKFWMTFLNLPLTWKCSYLLHFKRWMSCVSFMKIQW